MHGFEQLIVEPVDFASRVIPSCVESHNGSAAIDEGITRPTRYPASTSIASYSSRMGRAFTKLGWRRTSSLKLSSSSASLKRVIDSTPLRRFSQNWLIVRLSAEGRYAVDYDATSLRNGCVSTEPTTTAIVKTRGDQ